LLANKIETAFTIWVNGRKLSRVGVVGKDRQSARPQYLNALEFFWVEENHIEIIIQVSNFRHFQSGIVRSITLGNQKTIHSRMLNRRTFNVSMVSSFLISAMYNLIIFIRRRQNSASLFFGVLCFSFAAYIGLLLERIHIQLFPNFNWEFHYKILCFTFLYSGILYLLYLKAIFPDYADRKIVNTLWLGTTVIAFIILLTKAQVYNNIIGILYLLIIISILYCGHVLFNAIKAKQKGAISQSIPCLVFFIAALNDTLFSSGLIHTTRLAPTAILFFVIWQFFFMADAFAKSLNRSESLSESLAQANVKFASLLEECDVEVGKILVNLNQIAYIKSNGHYCQIFKNGTSKPIELNMQIGKIPTSIRNTRFLNVHRSYLMNFDKVKKIVRVGDNKYEALIKGTEDRIPVSRNKVSGLRKKHPILFN
jgi:two-component system sensor histidine kinase ChiS